MDNFVELLKGYFHIELELSTVKQLIEMAEDKLEELQDAKTEDEKFRIEFLKDKLRSYQVQLIDKKACLKLKDTEIFTELDSYFLDKVFVTHNEAEYVIKKTGNTKYPKVYVGEISDFIDKDEM